MSQYSESSTTAPIAKQEQWAHWEKWQLSQPSSHFESSHVLQSYLAQYPHVKCNESFLGSNTSNTSNTSNIYSTYAYCFGNFTILLSIPSGPGNVLEYVALLLEIYDFCKGLGRRIAGDPVGISTLRMALTQKTVEPIQLLDFSEYDYPYATLHAHTVAEFSLSTLILRLVSNYMSYTNVWGKNFSMIEYPICQNSYDNNVFKLTLSDIICCKCQNRLNHITIGAENQLCILCHLNTLIKSYCS